MRCGRVRAQEYLHIDETPYRVGRSSHKRGKQYKDGYLWPLLHPEVGVAFVYRPGRSNVSDQDTPFLPRLWIGEIAAVTADRIASDYLRNCPSTDAA